MNPDGLGLPFLTRDMLAWKGNATFSLRIATQCIVATPIAIRGFTKEGPFTLQHTTAAGGGVTTQEFRIPDIPIMVVVDDFENGFNQGDLRAVLSLVVNGDLCYELCSGLVYSGKGISWPTNYSTDARPNGARHQVKSITAPAAGAEFTTTVDSQEVWQIIGLSFRFVAAAAAASRRVHVIFEEGSNDIVHCFSSVDQIISENKFYTCAPYGAVPDETDGENILIPIPPGHIIGGGGKVKSKTTAINAGDQFSSINLIIDRWFAV